MWTYIFLGFLGLSELFLLFLWLNHYQLGRDVSEIIQTAKDIRTGNFNLRFRLQTTREDILELGGELNRLADYFQTALIRTNFLEEERKRMISNISHDLRTPLTSLLGYIEALRSDKTLTEEERREFLRISAEKGHDLLRLIEEFFELARLEEASHEIELQKIDLAELARTVILDFYPDFTRLSITPSLAIPNDPVYVKANPDSLRRVLNNLLSNALRYGQDGKIIGLTVRKELEYAFIEIWDRGEGIPAHDLPYIFERLYTAEASRNTSMRGTGLGLTIVKSLVEKQGGQIKADSIPGERTVFSFSLPSC
jgi:two-component system, OmpR family, phosphate regulon sensor histidine kinase PhoR